MGVRGSDVSALHNKTNNELHFETLSVGLATLLDIHLVVQLRSKDHNSVPLYPTGINKATSSLH